VGTGEFFASLNNPEIQQCPRAAGISGLIEGVKLSLFAYGAQIIANLMLVPSSKTTAREEREREKYTQMEHG